MFNSSLEDTYVIGTSCEPYSYNVGKSHVMVPGSIKLIILLTDRVHTNHCFLYFLYNYKEVVICCLLCKSLPTVQSKNTVCVQYRDDLASSPVFHSVDLYCNCQFIDIFILLYLRPVACSHISSRTYS